MNRQFSVSPEEALRNRFSGHRFITSPVGLFKLLAIIFLLVGSIISMTLDDCSASNSWLQIVFPTVTAVSGVIVTILYASSVLGLAKKIPKIWANVDIFWSLFISILTIIISILLLANCSEEGNLSKIPGAFGIAGSALLIVTTALIFITLRSAEEDVVEIPTPRTIDETKQSASNI